jgi:hypothetical protein
MPITHVAPVEHPESASVVARRRRVVGGVSLLGTGLLGLSLSSKPDSKAFYGLTSAVAATWTAGGLLSGPLHLGWIQSRDKRLRRPILTPVATGVGAFAFFYGCALIARRIPVLDRAIGNVLTFAEEGSGAMIVATTLANGVGVHVGDRLDPQSGTDAGGRDHGRAVRPATPCLRRPAGARPHPPHVVHPDGALPAAALPPRPRTRRGVGGQQHTCLPMALGGSRR